MTRHSFGKNKHIHKHKHKSENKHIHKHKHKHARMCGYSHLTRQLFAFVVVIVFVLVNAFVLS